MKKVTENFFMRGIIFLLMTVSIPSGAQIQFWTKDAIIEKQFEPVRKEMKIKTIYNYITSENWMVNDSLNYNEITEYDAGGRKISYRKYKTNWTTNKRFFQYIDSFFYNENGVLTGFRRYTPLGDGDRYRLETEYKSVLNKTGRIARINEYGGYEASALTGYAVYAYGNKNRVSKITAFDKSGTKDYEWTFQYDDKNRVSKVRARSEFGFKDIVIKYDAKGRLASYTELTDGKKKDNEAVYTYDAQGLLTKREYTTSYKYADSMQYWYRDGEKHYFRTYLKYPRPSGSDFSHEFLVYRFEYFD
jgi:hypothetical protein